MKVREKFDISKVIQWVKNRERIDLYCAGENFEKIMKAFYDCGFESKVDKVFDSDINKLGACIMGKRIDYFNNNTYLRENDILICSVKYGQEIYRKICNKGIETKKIYKLSDSAFTKEEYSDEKG